MSGARFSLYDTQENAATGSDTGRIQVLVNGEKRDYAESGADGTVTFKVKRGTWYMKEINNPDSTKYQDNDRIYVVIAEASGFTIKLIKNGAAQDTGVKDNGILNTSVAERTVILKKIGGDTFRPLPGAEYEIYSADNYNMSSELGSIKLDSSDANGIFFVGTLPLGKYYLIEKTVPTGYTATNYILYVKTDANGGVWVEPKP